MMIRLSQVKFSTNVGDGMIDRKQGDFYINALARIMCLLI